MVMYDNEFEKEENNFIPRIKLNHNIIFYPCNFLVHLHVNLRCTRFGCRFDTNTDFMEY